MSLDEAKELELQARCCASTAAELIVSFPDPAPLRGLGTLVDFLVRFKSCLCACAFQQRARDRIVSCPGGGVWVAVTREFERDNCVTSEILQSDWTIPNRAGVPRKSTNPLSCGSHVRVWDRANVTRPHLQ